jgi:hypothetical protein
MSCCDGYGITMSSKIMMFDGDFRLVNPKKVTDEEVNCFHLSLLFWS